MLFVNYVWLVIGGEIFVWSLAIPIIGSWSTS